MSWDRFGARLGVGLAAAGFFIIFLGWNGAASVDRVPSQFPYLISGGLAGLALVVVGAALMMVQSGREDGAKLRAEVVELRATLEKLESGPAATTAGPARGARSGSRDGNLVALGPTTFHRQDCRLLDGRGELPLLAPDAARERGLTPCRVCNPTAAKRGPSRKRPAGRKPARRKASAR